MGFLGGRRWWEGVRRTRVEMSVGLLERSALRGEQCETGWVIFTEGMVVDVN